MADQKVTDRVALSAGADPINDVLPIVDVSAGVSGSKKITINDLFTGWGMTPAGAALSKAASLPEQKAVLGLGSFEFHPEITSLVGGLPSSLDFIPTVELPLGTRRLLAFDGRLMIYNLVNRFTPADDVPYFIAPDDFNSSTNQKAWHQESVYFNGVTANALTLFNGTYNYGIAPGDVTSNRFVSLPDHDGEILLSKAVVRLSGVIPTTTTVPRIGDVLYYCDAPILTSHTLVLPSDAESRNGQSVIFKSRSEITAFTVAATGTALDTTMPTTITPGQTVEFVYCKLAAIWLRVK